MGKARARKKAMATTKKEMVTFTDLRDWSSHTMDKQSIGPWVEQHRLLCFNFRPKTGGEPLQFPFPEGCEFVWWPEVCSAPGSNFVLDNSLQVDEASERYNQFKETLIQKEEEIRRVLGLSEAEGEPSEAVSGQHANPLEDSELRSVVPGQQANPQLMDGEQTTDSQQTDEELPRVVYRDLRREAHKMGKPTVFELERDSFIAMVQVENLLCFNNAAYWKCFSQDVALLDAHKSHTPEIWFPHMKCEPCKDFVFQGTVFIDELSQQYENLVTTYLQVPSSSQSAPKAFRKTFTSLASFALNRKDQGKAEVLEQAGDDTTLEDQWQHVVSDNGRSLNTKQLLILMMKRQDNAMKVRESAIHDLSAKMEKVEASLSRRVNQVNASLSLVAERASRSNFGVFLQACHIECRILQPLTCLKLPYKKVVALERLACLCGKGENNALRQTPKEVEIDIFVRVWAPNFSGPRMSEHGLNVSTRFGLASSTFTHLVVAEVNQSEVLCNKMFEYIHPTQQECTSSTKLLYKLVQLERDIVACLEHFSVPLDVMLGACLISPSFVELGQPEHLLDALFFKCPTGLDNLKALYSKRQFWLMDL